MTRSNSAGTGGSRSSMSDRVPTQSGRARVSLSSSRRRSCSRRAARPLRSAVETAATARRLDQLMRSAERLSSANHLPRRARTWSSALSKRSHSAPMASPPANANSDDTCAAAANFTARPMASMPTSTVAPVSFRSRTRAFRRRRRESQLPPDPAARSRSSETPETLRPAPKRFGAVSRAVASSSSPPPASTSASKRSEMYARVKSRRSMAAFSRSRAADTSEPADGRSWPAASRAASASRRSFDPKTIGSGPGALLRRSTSASTVASDLAAINTRWPRARASQAVATTVWDLPVPGAPDTAVSGSERLADTAIFCTGVRR